MLHNVVSIKASLICVTKFPSPFQVMCKLQYFVQAMSYTASVNILTAISIERYFAIIHPIRSKQLTSLCLLRATIIVIWILSAFAGLPFLVFYSTTPPIVKGDIVMYFCIPVHEFSQKAYVTSNAVMWYVIPLVLMSAIYSRIAVVLWQSSQGMDGTASVGGVHGGTARRAGNGGSSIVKTSAASTNGTSSSGMDRKKECGRKYAEEQQCLMEAEEERRQRTARLLKRMDSNVSDDGGIPPENQTSNSCESDPEDDWPSSRNRNKARHTEIRMVGMATPSSTYTYTVCNDSSKNGVSGARATGPPRPGALGGVKGLFKRSSGKAGNALLARRRVIRLLVVVIVSFAVCMLPYHVRVLLQQWNQQHAKVEGFWNTLFTPITLVIYYLNSGLNPFFYAFLSDRFRKCFVEVMTCRDNKNVRYFTSHSMKTGHSTV